MKKIGAFITGIMVCLGCFPSFSHAGPRPVDQITSDPFSDLSTDEYVFAAQLNDPNRQAFVHMSSQQRAECMHMTNLFNTTGTTLNPDAAVEKVVSTLYKQD